MLLLRKIPKDKRDTFIRGSKIWILHCSYHFLKWSSKKTATTFLLDQSIKKYKYLKDSSGINLSMETLYTLLNHYIVNNIQHRCILLKYVDPSYLFRFCIDIILHLRYIHFKERLLHIVVAKLDFLLDYNSQESFKCVVATILLHSLRPKELLF